MKTTTKLIFTLFALGLAATAPLARAADEPATPPMKHAQGGKRVQKAAQEHDKMLTEKLKLTAEQQTKLAAIRKDEAEQLKAVRGDRAKMADVLKAGREQVRAILTPEQQTEFDAIKPEGRGGKKGKKAAEQP
jgi:Spy/CpxP family protein refolding chaperone